MNAQSHRNDNSVQMSLAQLRNLHTARLESEKEMEEQRSRAIEAQRLETERLRMAEERAAEEKNIQLAYEREQQRLAAEHELQLAKERARVDAEARVREKQLELQLKQADKEMLATQAAMPKPRSWVGMALVAVLLLGLQGGLFWQQRQASAEVDAVHETARENQRDAYDAAKSLQGLHLQLDETTQELAAANQRADELAQRLESLEKGQPASNKNPARPSSDRRIDNKPKPDRPPTPVGPITAKCLENPLC